MSSVLQEIPPLVEKKTSYLALLRSSFRRHRMAYLMLVPGIAFFLVFSYYPMYGLIISFKDFKGSLGILGSPWVGFKHFQVLFASEEFYRIFRNTLLINTYKLVFFFPVPVILALLINEIGRNSVKRPIQTILYFPHFLSWVVVGSIVYRVLGYDGIANALVTALGGERISFLSDVHWFRSILVVSATWKEAGWGTILYLAALCTIDPGLYDAALVDGAGRWKQTLHVSLPGIASTFAVLLILRIGGMMSTGFEQIFVLYNPMVYEVGDVFGTYIYRTGLLTRRFSYSTAVGMFQSVVSMILIYTANRVANRMGGHGIW